MKRPWQITNEEQWIRDCREIVQVSQDVLDGNLGVIKGARLLTALRLRVRAEDDEDFLVFVGIDSQTDHFPLGVVRGQWEAKALSRYDAERQRAETDFRENVEDACRRLIQKYDDAA